MLDIIACILNVVFCGVFIMIPLSVIVRLAVAVFSPQARLSIGRHPIAHSIWFASGALLAILLVLVYAHGRAEIRAKFINLMNDVKYADYELRQYGSFTNHSQYTRVYACTNRYTVGGTDYWCELCGGNGEFGDRGTLAITTNQTFLWIDNKHGVISLILQGPQMTLPPGI
jgi:hypothetical protein